MPSSDRQITCVDCQQSFVFSAAEQSFFAQQGFQEPRRCKACRAQRKDQKGGGRSAGPAQGQRSGGGGQGGQNAPRRSANGNGYGNGNGNQGGNDSRGNRAPRAAAAPRMPSPNDPNGYRAPGFAAETRSEYAIDYAGLPKDEEEEAGAAPPARPAFQGGDRFGMRTAAPVAGGNGRGRFGARTPDRTGTDPNAYRAPGFAPKVREGARGPQAPRQQAEPKPRRPEFQVKCADCGVDTTVPFEPAADRAAYCKDCFQSRRSAGTLPRRPGRGEGDAPGKPPTDGDLSP